MAGGQQLCAVTSLEKLEFPVLPSTTLCKEEASLFSRRNQGFCCLLLLVKQCIKSFVEKTIDNVVFPQAKQKGQFLCQPNFAVHQKQSTLMTWEFVIQHVHIVFFMESIFQGYSLILLPKQKKQAVALWCNGETKTQGRSCHFPLGKPDLKLLCHLYINTEVNSVLFVKPVRHTLLPCPVSKPHIVQCICEWLVQAGISMCPDQGKASPSPAQQRHSGFVASGSLQLL